MNIYNTKIKEYQQQINELSSSLKRLSTFRVLVFIFSITAIMLLANARLSYGLMVAIPLFVVGFGIVLKRYNRLKGQKEHIDFLRLINENEILRQNNQLAGFDPGQEFIDHNHPYASDLDIFGSHSLFQLINRTTTESGKAMLANWMLKPASKKEIFDRQQAIRELATKLDWRQDFQASGMRFENSKGDYSKLLSWIESPVQLHSQKITLVLTGITMTGATILSAGYFLNTLVHGFSAQHAVPFVACLLTNFLILRRVRPVAEEIIESTKHNVKTLAGYQSLIKNIESENFISPKLIELRSAFSGINYSAAVEIQKLKKVLEIFQQKGTRKSIGKNDFYTIFNLIFYLDIYLILLTEKWKLKNSNHVRQWASTVSEFEVLASLAGFSYSNPTYIFPEIIEEQCRIHFEKLGHPLLSEHRKIRNNFDLNGEGEIAMITGSNMAGKSTFLRTVGINVVLALTGAPCDAKTAQVSHMKLFSSMRTQDNLAEGVSSFYAELKKIEQLLTLIEKGESVFFLLDEMFKGTNSQDRYRGGVSLIKQLNDLKAFGIISTHDLELAKLAGHHMIVANFSFNSEIREEEMIFNYTLTKGICKDFNASELMKKSGIRILEDIESIQ